MVSEQHGEHLGRGRAGCVEVVCGSMFSGKTEELLRRIRRAQLAKQLTMLFKPKVDDRYDAVKVVSHAGANADAIPVASAADLLRCVDSGKNVGVVGVDEVQFFDGDIVRVVNTLADRGVRVIVAGLDQDYRCEPFGPMPSLLAIAEYVTKLHAVCAACGGTASRSQRRVAAEAQLFVGGSADYEARCRHCYFPGVLDR